MRYVLVCALIPAFAACGGGAPEPESRAADVPETNVERPAPPPDAPLLVAFGDSLTAGYGLEPGEAYPAVLERLLAERGAPHRVVNEGVSGDTTASALARLEAVVARDPDWVIVALGANDGLRGLSLDSMEENLRTIVARFHESDAQVVLAGMKLPPNYGPEYTADFEAIYPRLADELDVPLLPFLLDGVAAETSLNQSDGIHPTAEGAAAVAEHVADFLLPLLEKGPS